MPKPADPAPPAGPTDRPQLLCWIGRGQQPGEYFADEDLARAREAADLRFVLVAKGQSVSDRQVVEESRQADAVLFAWDTAVYPDAVLEQCPRLRFLGRFGGGIRGLIGTRAWDRGIRVVTAVEAMGSSIAELTVAMMLAGLYRLTRHYELQKSTGPLTMEAGEHLGQRSVASRTVGLVGFGTVGRHVARMLAPFGCRVLAYDPHVEADEMAALNVQPVADLADLARRSDVLSLHAPHLPSTHGMISREILQTLRPGSLLVNTAWAHLVDMQALTQRVLAGELVACLDNVDLLYGDGPATAQPLRACPDCLITTLIGMHADCLHAMGRQLLDEARRFFHGQPLRHEVPRRTLDTRA